MAENAGGVHSLAAITVAVVANECLTNGAPAATRDRAVGFALEARILAERRGEQTVAAEAVRRLAQHIVANALTKPARIGADMRI